MHSFMHTQIEATRTLYIFFLIIHRRHQAFLRGSRLKGRESLSAEGASNLGGHGHVSPRNFCRKSVL